VAIVHDYLTQRGGAERLVLTIARAFPGAPIYTSLYEPSRTFREFAELPVRPGRLEGIPGLRHHHRLAFPVLAPAFSFTKVEAPVVVCSSSGWAHGVRTTGPKIVYCHTPARWLYQRSLYLGQRPPPGASAALGLLGPTLRRWDRWAAGRSHRYLTNSTAVRDRIWATYGVEAEVLPPPPTLDPDGRQEAVPDLEPGFFLCVSRLLPYKNVDAVMHAISSISHGRLVVVGAGPDEARLRAHGCDRVRLLGTVDDDVLRWCYANCSAVVAASYEDFGLTPLEGNGFGKPAAVLRAGGFLDTVVEGVNGVFFDEPNPNAIAAALVRLASDTSSPSAIRAHASRFSETRFAQRLVEIVAEESRVHPA
jgi:glycosyltransferase involved in cell wall biosynthesis